MEPNQYQNNPYQDQQNPYQNQQNPYQNQQNPYGSAPQYNAPQYNYQQQYSQPQPTASKGQAIGSMICGILSICFAYAYGLGLIPAIIALVLNKKFVTANNGATNGMAKAGKICGIIGLIFSIIAAVIWFIVLMVAIAAASA